MRPVRPTPALHVAVAVAIGLVLGTSVPELARRMGEVPPRPGWVAPLVLAALAFGLGSTARGTWRSLRDDHRKMHSELGLRLLLAHLVRPAALASVLGGPWLPIGPVERVALGGHALLPVWAHAGPTGGRREHDSACTCPPTLATLSKRHSPPHSGHAPSVQASLSRAARTSLASAW